MERNKQFWLEKWSFLTWINIRKIKYNYQKPWGVACSDSVSHNRVQVLSLPVLLLACNEDWTCNLQMIVSLEAQETNAYNSYVICWCNGYRRWFPELQ